ncbi:MULTISPECIES: hypothetical protein [Nocardia]|uniref:DUF4266 domain-containing protein n=1 Tax=Nocardia sputorum TaxID=2984338 RepID=A0ABN6U0Z5_9NOCA|nr:hypothetical protein [Nocardia sputorum]BDT90286.1 hypothetical protein IFM12275_02620 [Nocardia sputorum]BDT98906.1 hypothetical protein IFM12276_19350 [Nocardia sputorum]
MGHLLLVLLALVLVAAPLGVGIMRRTRSPGRIGGDATTRARAAGAQLSKDARAHRWRYRPYGKSNNDSGGGAGCAGGGCAGGE